MTEPNTTTSESPAVKAGRFRGPATFRAKIFWSIIPFIVLLLVFHGIVALREHKVLVTEEFMKRGQALAKNLASSSELAVFTEDAKLLESSIRGVIGDPDVAFVVIYRENGELLAKGGRASGGLDQSRLALGHEEMAQLVENHEPFSKRLKGDPGELIEIIAPVVSPEVDLPDELLLGPLEKARSEVPQRRQRLLGVVRLGLSLQSVENQAFALLELWGSVGLVFILLGTLVIYALSRHITRPINRLTEHAEKLGRGLLDQAIPVESQDEIGQLAGTFNEMARSLKRNIDEKERLLSDLRGVNESLRESEMRFRSVAESASDAIVSADSRGMIIYWNRGAQAIFGYEETEVVGQELTLLMPEASRELCRSGRQRVNAGEPYRVIGKTVELRGVRKDGKEFPLELSLATWTTGEGRFFSAIIRDITERKRAEESLRESEERFALAVQGSSDGLWDATPLPDEPWHSPRTPVWWSPRLKEMLGYEEHEFEHVLESWTSRLHPEDKDRVFSAIFAHVEQKVPYDMEYRLRTKQEDYRWFSARGQGIWDNSGKLLRMAGSLRDITERKRTEEALQSLTVSLEQKVQERTADLQIARDHALEATRHKSEFLANMSHELRTPLNAVLGFSEVLLEKMFGDLNPKQEEYVQDILSSGRHLLSLINDILDLSKVEAGRMELELCTFDLPALLRNMLALVRERALRNGIQVGLEIDQQLGEFTADERKVKQVLLNLLSNAVKFTPDGGTITVKAGLSGGFAEVSVSDTGIGIAPENQDKVFEAFYQAGDPTARKREGTGLGLTLAKQFVELHGGQIWVKSEKGLGSTFTFTLPSRATLEKPCVPAIETPVIHRERPLALVVEDDLSAAKLLSIYLTEAEFEVEVANDAEAGFEKARIFRPAVITLDILMPRLDGWDLLVRLKANPVTASIPVVIVSIVDERGKGFALGAAEYIVKPVDREELISSVRRVVRPPVTDRRDVTILAVDDDPVVLELIDAALKPEGFQVLKAPGGMEGLSLARERGPDLIVLDLLMPNVDGFQVLDELKRDPVTSTIPVVVLTCKSLTPEEKGRLKGRISDLKQKGEFNRADFVAQVRSVLNLGLS